MAVDEQRFRAAMARMPTGVTVLTTLGSRPEVMTANAVTSVSLNPMLLLASVSAQSRWLASLRECGIFSVNVLGAQQEQLARWCADRARHENPEAIADYSVRTSPGSGLLLFDEALVAIECRTYAEHAAGDHVLVLGEVTSLHVHDSSGPPLLFHDRAYSALPGLGRIHRLDGSISVYPADLEVPAAAASG